jgi:prevent-host-death family protein
MPSQVNIHEAKTHFSSLVDRALRGEEIIIARGGKPVAKLVPLTPEAPRQAGLLKGIFDERFFEPMPEEELAAIEE